MLKFKAKKGAKGTLFLIIFTYDLIDNFYQKKLINRLNIRNRQR
jgi:hypothetical protein